ncbi:MAG: prepilin-type N-terminal cleavage/methylation domain-containing protein [bacterium]
MLSLHSYLKKKLKSSHGFTLIEVILIIVVLSIAIPSLMQLISSTLVNSNQSVIISQAIVYAQEKMEEIISDKKSPTKGYDWVITPGNYPSDVPSNGFTRTVLIEAAGRIYNGIPYAFVQVKISHNEIPDIKLTTWLTDY